MGRRCWRVKCTVGRWRRPPLLKMLFWMALQVALQLLALAETHQGGATAAHQALAQALAAAVEAGAASGAVPIFKHCGPLVPLLLSHGLHQQQQGALGLCLSCLQTILAQPSQAEAAVAGLLGSWLVVGDANAGPQWEAAVAFAAGMLLSLTASEEAVLRRADVSSERQLMEVIGLLRQMLPRLPPAHSAQDAGALVLQLLAQLLQGLLYKDFQRTATAAWQLGVVRAAEAYLRHHGQGDSAQQAADAASEAWQRLSCKLVAKEAGLWKAPHSSVDPGQVRPRWRLARSRLRRWGGTQDACTPCSLNALYLCQQCKH
jgi:hypothetical protein